MISELELLRRPLLKPYFYFQGRDDNDKWFPPDYLEAEDWEGALKIMQHLSKQFQAPLIENEKEWVLEQSFDDCGGGTRYVLKKTDQ